MYLSAQNAPKLFGGRTPRADPGRQIKGILHFWLISASEESTSISDCICNNHYGEYCIKPKRFGGQTCKTEADFDRCSQDPHNFFMGARAYGVGAHPMTMRACIGLHFTSRGKIKGKVKVGNDRVYFAGDWTVLLRSGVRRFSVRVRRCGTVSALSELRRQLVGYSLQDFLLSLFRLVCRFWISPWGAGRYEIVV